MKKSTHWVITLCAALCVSTVVSAEQNSFCPPVGALQKNATQGNWTAQTKAGYWKSYDMSFATNITRFVGAQWNGANVGQLTCIYHSEEVFTMQGQQQVQKTLPILLIFHTLAFQPTKGKWKRVSRGVYNCYSGKRTHCPFKVNMPAPEGNIYQQAEALKEEKQNKLQPPSY